MCQTCKTPKEDLPIRKFRHRFEVPMIVVAFFIILVAVLVALHFFVNGDELSDWVSGILVGLLIPLAAFFTIRYLYWQTISNGVEISEKQLPEIYDMYIQLANEMGFTPNGKLKTPRLYLKNGNGVMNAFAAKCSLRRRYIVLHSDLVDVAYTNDTFEFLKFVLAHELGHHKCRHTSIWRLILTTPLQLLFLDKSLTRAQEYTADRVAMYYAEEGAMDLIYLFSGKYMGARIDM